MELVAGGSKTNKYSWMLHGPEMLCYPSKANKCTVHTKFWEPEEARPFHDETLMEATKAINRLLASAAERRPDPEWELCFIEFQNRPFLAWSKPEGGLTSDDDPAAVAHALGLPYDPSSPSTG